MVMPKEVITLVTSSRIFNYKKKKKKKVGLELTYIYIVAFILMSRYDSNPTFKVGKFSYDLGTQHEIIELGFEGFDRPV
jgi:hypothetical protein